MIDRREQILARLSEILSEIPNVKTVGRNVGELTAKSRPAIVLHDGVEEKRDMANRPSYADKAYMHLTPQIWVFIGGRSMDIGPATGPFRAAIVSAIWKDATLKTICGPQTGDIEFNGCGFDSSAGETREARLEINFTFTYVVDRNELTAE